MVSETHPKPERPVTTGGGISRPPDLKGLALLFLVILVVLGLYLLPVLWSPRNEPSADDLAAAKLLAKDEALQQVAESIVLNIPESCFANKLTEEQLKSLITNALHKLSDQTRGTNPDKSERSGMSVCGDDGGTNATKIVKNWEYGFPCELKFLKPITILGRQTMLEPIDVCRQVERGVGIAGLVSLVAKACEHEAHPNNYIKCISNKFRELWTNPSH